MTVVAGNVSEVEHKETYIRYVTQIPEQVDVITFKIKTDERMAARGPASTIPRDDLEAVPPQDQIWLNSVFVEDNAGVMNNIRNQLHTWQKMEEYRQNWDVESTGLYETPDDGRKKAWFNRMLLRYADKRLSGEMKNAAQGSTLRRVSNVQKALKPDTEATISRNIKLKFKARVLQLEGRMTVVNPWVESETTFNAQGEIHTRVAKNIKTLGIRTEVFYQVHDGNYQAVISKPLSQKVTAVLSSSQSDNQVAFADLDRNTVQLIYSTPF
jgi:hypothetical protein